MGELGELVPQAPRSHSKSSFANSRHVPQIPAQDSRTVSPFPADFRFFPPNLAVSRVISQYVIPSCSRLFQEFPFVAQSFLFLLQRVSQSFLFLHFFALFFSKLPFSSFSFLLFPKTERRNNREMQSGGRTGKVLALYKLSCPLKRRGGLAYSPAAQRLEQKP